MANNHFLEQSGDKVRVIVHFPVPAGNNSSGVSWKNVILGAGLNKSVLATGTIPGQIASTELATITAGDVVEMDLQVPVFSGGQSGAQVLATIAAARQNRLLEFQERYKYFGREV